MIIRISLCTMPSHDIFFHFCDLQNRNYNERYNSKTIYILLPFNNINVTNWCNLTTCLLMTNGLLPETEISLKPRRCVQSPSPRFLTRVVAFVFRSSRLNTKAVPAIFLIWVRDIDLTLEAETQRWMWRMWVLLERDDAYSSNSAHFTHSSSRECTLILSLGLGRVLRN